MNKKVQKIFTWVMLIAIIIGTLASIFAYLA